MSQQHDAGDTLVGGNPIADFINNEILDPGRQIDRKEVYRLMDAGILPGGHLGSLRVASKRKLRKHFDKITGDV